jgi:hypothetical protein
MNKPLFRRLPISEYYNSNYETEFRNLLMEINELQQFINFLRIYLDGNLIYLIDDYI